MDFFINYYVSFLMDKHIPLLYGFFLWHAVVFLLVLITVLISVFIFLFLKNRILSTLTTSEKIQDKQNLQEDIFIVLQNGFDNKFGLILSILIFLSSVLFMFFIMPLSTSLFPIKTDIGAGLFLSLLLLPIVAMMFAVCQSNNQNIIKSWIKKIFHYFSAFIPVFISCISVFILSGTLSFRDIVSVQNSLGIITWFCFPALIGLFVIIYSLAELYVPEDNNSNNIGLTGKFFDFTKNIYLFVVCMYIVTLFFGGYMPPLSLYLANMFEHSQLWYGIILSFEQTFWLMLKTIILLLFITLLKQYGLIGLNQINSSEMFWKYLTPLSIINLLSVCMIAINFGGFYVI